MGILLGIDGGGTKTVCSLANSEREVLTKSYSGPSNYHKSGVYSAKTSIREAVWSGLRTANFQPVDVDAACAGLAGVYQEEDYSIMSRSLSDVLPETEWILESDAFITLIGATGVDLEWSSYREPAKSPLGSIAEERESGLEAGDTYWGMKEVATTSLGEV